LCGNNRLDAEMAEFRWNFQAVDFLAFHRIILGLKKYLKE
jgi:hypothetical protein